MTKDQDAAMTDGTAIATGVLTGDVLPPSSHPPIGRKAGSTDDLNALHADLTTTYREYLEMAKIKPSMLNPAMLGLIQQFLRHNEITAEAPQQSETDTLQKRLEQKRKARDIALSRQNILNLNQANTG